MDDLDGIPRSSREPDPIAQMMQLFKRLDSRMSVVERAAPQRSMSISQDGSKRITVGPLSFDLTKYGIEVLDNTGKARVRLGELQSQPGNYGAEVLAGSSWVPLASTAAGGTRTTVAAQYDVNVAAGNNSGWVSAGPTVVATTYTGKIDVTVGGALATTGNRSTIAFSYSIINDVTGVVAAHPDQFRAVAARHNGFGMTAYQQGEMTISHDLPPGTYRVVGKAQTYGSVSEFTTANITNRTVGVRGY